MQDAPFKYPRAAVGHIFAVASLVSGAAAWITGARHVYVTPTLRVMSLAYGFIAWAYFVWAVYRIHRILRQATNQKYPVKPLRALGLQLVPFYSFYWSFKWTGEIAHFLNHLRRDSRFPLDRWGWVLLLAVFPGILVPGVPQILGFAVIGKIVSRTQITLAAHTLPIESYEKENYRSVPAVAASWVLSVLMVLGSALAVLAFGHFSKMASAR